MQPRVKPLWKQAAAIAICALSLGPTSALAAPKIVSQTSAAKAFAAVCLANFGSFERVGQSAKKRGFGTVSKDHWARPDYTLSAVVIPAGKRGTTVDIEMAPLGVVGWDFVSLRIPAGGRKGACAVLASTPPKDLYKSVVTATARYGAPTTRIRAKGNAATISVQIDGGVAEITVKPLRLQGHKEFSVIMVARK